MDYSFEQDWSFEQVLQHNRHADNCKLRNVIGNDLISKYMHYTMTNGFAEPV